MGIGLCKLLVYETGVILTWNVIPHFDKLWYHVLLLIKKTIVQPISQFPSCVPVASGCIPWHDWHWSSTAQSLCHQPIFFHIPLLCHRHNLPGRSCSQNPKYTVDKLLGIPALPPHLPLFSSRIWLDFPDSITYLISMLFSCHFFAPSSWELFLSHFVDNTILACIDLISSSPS